MSEFLAVLFYAMLYFVPIYIIVRLAEAHKKDTTWVIISCLLFSPVIGAIIAISLPSLSDEEFARKSGKPAPQKPKPLQTEIEKAQLALLKAQTEEVNRRMREKVKPAKKEPVTPMDERGVPTYKLD